MSAGKVPGDETTSVFTALSDPTRRHILELVSHEPGVTASGLAGRLTISRQAVTKHLAVLVDTGLVTATREGREVRHHVHVEPLHDAAHWLLARADAWNDRLSMLKTAAEAAAAERGTTGG